MTKDYKPSAGEHPITPPPELVDQWSRAALVGDWGCGYDLEMIATQAARWSADQELEACCEWVQGNAWCGDSLRAARRRKLPSLKEKALEALGQIPTGTYMVIDPESGVLSAKPWSNSMTDTNNNNHPITPPPELVQQWRNDWVDQSDRSGLWVGEYIANKYAQWGADQELEACCEWLRESLATPSLVECFLANRRPKPPSLKEQALEALAQVHHAIEQPIAITIRRALEQLDD